MSFGDHVTPAGSIASAGWIGTLCDGEPWTVGSIVPNLYESVVRVEAPAEQENWWDAYRQLFDSIASVGARHTDTADRARFAIWEGHGFDTVVHDVAPHDRPDDLGPDETGWARLPSSYRRRVAARRTPLAEIPRFELPNRSYYLVQGAVTAVSQLRKSADTGRSRCREAFCPGVWSSSRCAHPVLPERARRSLRGCADSGARSLQG